MYRRLSGMTGTAWEERCEFWQTYGTPTARIPTNRPIQRTLAPDHVLSTEDAKWAAVADAVQAGHATGQTGAGGHAQRGGQRDAEHAC